MFNPGPRLAWALAETPHLLSFARSKREIIQTLIVAGVLYGKTDVGDSAIIEAAVWLVVGYVGIPVAELGLNWLRAPSALLQAENKDLRSDKERLLVEIAAMRKEQAESLWHDPDSERERRRRLKDMLADLYTSGQAALEGHDGPTCERWGRIAQQVVGSAFGRAEALVWISRDDNNLDGGGVGSRTWMKARLGWLRNRIDRIGEVEIEVDFEPFVVPPIVPDALPPQADEPGEPPRVTVEPYDGAEGILLVRNLGGPALFRARSQIVAVEKVGIKHTAPYLMIWRNIETHREEKGHKAHIPADGESKLVVSSPDWRGNDRHIMIHGDGGVVDSYSGGWRTKTPQVTIEVEITASPQLAERYKERFITLAPAGDESLVFVRRLKQDSKPNG